MKLGDFNRAEFPDFDPVHGQYCTYKNGRGAGNVSQASGYDFHEHVQQDKSHFFS